MYQICKNFKVIFRGPSWKIDQALQEANTVLGKSQDLFYPNKESLIKENTDYKEAASSSIDVWDGTAAPAFPGARRFLVRKLKTGDVPNLNVLRVSLLEARIKELNTSDPFFEKFLRASEVLLGQKIQNVPHFIMVLENGTSDDLGFYAIPPLLHVEQVLQVLRMAQKMAEQSA